MKQQYKKKEEQAIFDAMWQWVLDHSDLDSAGTLFVKAHIKDKETFARSISYRVNGYYRSYWKEELINDRKNQHAERVALGIELKKVEKRNKQLLLKKKLL